MMFSKNQKISGRQLNRMLALDLFAVASMLLPKFLLHTCGGQGIYAVILGAIGTVIYGGLLYYAATRYTDNLFLFAKRTVGTVMAWLILIYFMIRFLLSAVYLLKMFSQVINRTFLTEMPEWVIAALMIIAALYGVSRGIEARGRFGSLLFWIVVIPMAVIVLLSLSEIKTERIFPMMVTSCAEIVDGGFVTVTLFSVAEFVLFAAPYVRNGKRAFHFLVKAIIFGAVTAGIIYLACIGVMTVAGAQDEQWPSVILMQIIRLPGRFMSRQDGLMLTFWIAAAFMVVSGYIFYADEMVHQLCPKHYFKGVWAFWVAVVYGAFCMIKDYQAFERLYFKTAFWAGLVPTTVILLILVIKDSIQGNVKGSAKNNIKSNVKGTTKGNVKNCIKGGK